MSTKLKVIVATLSFFGATGLAAANKEAKKPARQVEVSVTTEGFQPEEIKTKKGEELRLVITRKTDKTCAKQIVIKDLGIQKALPLNEAVTVDITPKNSGHLRYACSMDMISGVIVVD